MIIARTSDGPLPSADLEQLLNRSLICPDFDVGCYGVGDPGGCKKGRSVRIGETIYFTLPVLAVCPLSDP